MSKLFLPLSLALSIGCGESSLPKVSHEGRRFVVAADPALVPCSGSLERMDDFVERIAKEFSVPLSDNSFGPIRFFWLDTDGFHSRAPCDDAFLACTRPPDTVYSTVFPSFHEIVHAVALQLGHPPSFFAEGLAVAYQGLGDDIQSLGPVSLDYDVREFAGMTGVELSLEPGAYDAAGAFTSFLVSHFGLQSYLQVYAGLDRGATMGDIDLMFLEAFAVDFEGAVAAFEDSFVPFCARADHDSKLIECGAQEIAWDGSSLAVHKTISCSDQAAIGPFHGDSVVVMGTVNISEAGLYQLKTVGDPVSKGFSGVTLHFCGPCVPLSSVRLGVGEPPRVVQLQAGRYSLRLHGSAAEETSLGVLLSRSAPALEED